MLDKFLRKDTNFFTMFEEAALNVNRAAALLIEMMEDLDLAEVKAKEIYESEQEGDLLTHEIMRNLNKTFITPMDREDIHALVKRLDDIVDLVWWTADKAVIFQLHNSREDAVDLTKTLHKTTEFITKAISFLKDKQYQYVQECCIEINRMENLGDRIFKKALATLFDELKDPVLLIKWKEVYEHLEDAHNVCEEVANILESILLKNS